MNLFDRVKIVANYIDGFLSKIYSFANKPSIKKLNFALIIVVSFIGIFILNRLNLFFGDDWMYSMLPEPSNEHVKSFKDILYTQYEHYFTWGGRSVVHVIAQTLLFLGDLPADILNSIAYVGLTLVIYTFVNKGNKLNPSLLILINLLICFFQPAFGSTMLWTTGSANYLWGTLIIVSFLLPYKTHIDKKSNDSYIKAFLFLLFGIVAGWTNENMGVALIYIVVLIILYYIYENITIPKWAVSGLIGAIIGCGFMIAAPGNYARMGMVISSEVAATSSTTVFISRFGAAFASYYYYCLALTFIYALLYPLSRFYSNESKKKQTTMLSIIILSGAIIATLVMSVSPIFPGRAAYGINTLIIIAAMLLYANFDFNHILIKRLSAVVITFGLLFYAADYYRGYRELNIANKIIKERIAFVEEEKSKGKQDIVLTEKVPLPATRYFHHFDLQADSTNWHNRMFSRYFEIQSIKMKD